MVMHCEGTDFENHEDGAGSWLVVKGCGPEENRQEN